MSDRLKTVQVRDRFDAQFEARWTRVWYRRHGLGPAFEISADTQATLQRRYHSRFRLAAMGFGAVILAPVIVRVLRGDTPLMHQSHLEPEGTGLALWIGLGLVGLILTRTVLWHDPDWRVRGLTPVAPALAEDARDHVVLPSMSWVHIHAVLFSAVFIPTLQTKADQNRTPHELQNPDRSRASHKDIRLSCPATKPV